MHLPSHLSIHAPPPAGRAPTGAPLSRNHWQGRYRRLRYRDIQYMHETNIYIYIYMYVYIQIYTYT